ncbi:high-affinity choline transporter 1-like [Scyliorhinus canicula]|uniref:high-affinity choline transporter 1-like n=1 Tax=Scyliorhinus canicula TaxID=7830 RepID=UPI0018F6930C|nr:high-affinity choline transporter 1-like [Scyliorhinus canicula]
MAINIAGAVSMASFYLLILTVGIWAAKRAKKAEGTYEGDRPEMVMIAGRKIGVVLGILTTTATWVGGAYINGTAEMVYRPDAGLVWTVAPWTSLLCLLIGGLFFAKKMRAEQYITMLDPFQLRYGKRIASLVFFPAIIGEIFWSAAILAALGTTSSVVLDLDKNLSVVISACVAMIYTLLGGLYSVAYTDVIQLGCIFFGLWLCVPFTMLNNAVTSIKITAVKEVHQKPWLGKIDERFIGKWIDDLLLMVLGAIPWQAYFQRVLASSSIQNAQTLSIAGAFGGCIMGIPSVLIGSVAASTDWNQTSYGSESPYEKNEAAMILPLVLRYLCPPYISIFGIGAIAAAVMSSTDSSLLSSSSMFTHNIYRKILRPKASEKEILYAMKTTILVVTILATTLALFTNTIYGLYALSADLVYVILFPQLVCVLYVPCVNRLGFVTGVLTAAVLRVAGGEPLFHFPAAIHFPGGYFQGGDYIQIFPYKTFAMLSSLMVTVTLSYISKLKWPEGYVTAYNLTEISSEPRTTA